MVSIYTPLSKQYDHYILRNDLLTLTTKQLKKKYKVSSQAIYTACRHLNIDPSRLKSTCLISYDTPEKHQLLEDLKSGKLFVAQKYNCTIPVVNRWIRQHQITIEPYHGVKSNIPAEHVESLILQGHTDREIARKLNTSPATVERIAKRNGQKVKKTSDQWKIQRQKLEDSFDYICDQNKTRDILAISQELGIDHSVILRFLESKNYNVISHSYCKSRGEIEVLEFVRSLGVESKSVRIKHNGLCREFDVFVESHKVAIEYCGEYWHSSLHKPKNYHAEKQSWAEDQGIKLLTIFEHEWRDKRKLIESMIKTRLNIVENKYMARKTSVRKITAKEASVFLNENHIQGDLKNSPVSYGLFDQEDRMLSVMSFTKPRFSKGFEWEIARFATLQDTVVVGGASKLFQKFIKDHSPKNCMSFCDRRFGVGQVYKNVGFTETRKTPPGYFYFNTHKFQKISRFQAQKHKLSSIIDNFDPQLTEYQNMYNNKFLKIFDCGNTVFEWFNERQ